jgi:hypothetical protein
MNSRIAVPPGQAGGIKKAARVAATLLFAGLVTPAFMFAAGLNGNLSLSSNGISTIAVNGLNIDFDYTGGSTNTFPPTATNSAGVDGSGDSGLFDITNASTGSFSNAVTPGIVGTTVTVHDLNSIEQPTGVTSGPGLPLINFVTFALKPTWSITLTEILPGNDGTAGCASGNFCTPPGSPFNLQNEGGNQVLVGFAFMGTASDGLGNVSPVTGTFSTTFSNTTLQGLLTALGNGQAIVSSANATIGVPTIPEPRSFSLLLLGTGLLTVSGIYRRKRQRP